MPEEEEREKLAKVIRQWNNNRLDLFEISQPDENLEFHGVMRFYFEDHVVGNVATKCLRICSNSPTHEVIETLSEKFRPDMKMLTTSYSLYEIHTNKERKLDPDEKPLVVQLNWNLDNKEGRFVLKKDSSEEKEKGGMIQNFKRTLSRKGKKKEKTNAADKEPFLSAVINYTNSSTVYFKLSPAYILYVAGRFALQRHRGRSSPPSGRTYGVTSITNKMVAMTGKVIQRQQTIAGALAFWMANSSELLNFLKHDKDLGPLTQQSQLDLSHLVHKAYSCLLQCLQNELKKHLPTFLIDPEQHDTIMIMVLNTLMNAMSLLRCCRVNPALTIQLFSQLFHFISARLFNQLMSPESSTPGLRSHYWGAALRQRLTGIEAWAERQGLELAADCHLGHIIQATTLLTMNKYSTQDAKDIQSTCFKLNSLQLQMLLVGYLYATNEPHIPPDLIDAVVAAAEASADNLIRSEGRDIQLEESLDLHLPFLLPEGGYSCDTVRGIPQGFTEFMEPICQKGLCSLMSQLNSKGDWTVHFSESAASEERTHLAAHRQPEVVTITLNKPLNSGMGVSIVAAKGAGQGNIGIYIKSIVKGGPAEMNGRLTAGDQLLSVDGQSLVGLSQERAAAIMMQTGPVVTLQVAKFGASYHGLGALLSEPTPERTTGKKIPEGKSVFFHSALMNTFSRFTREYLTLPTPKSQDKGISESSRPQQTFKASLRPLDGQRSNQRTFMSQENLCMDSGGPLLDKRQKDQAAKQTTSHYSSFPIRSSVSTHDILSESTKPQQGSRTSNAGVWRTPFSQHSAPTPSVQPIRIDIPITRAVSTQSNPPLTTFQVKMNQTLKVNKQSPQAGQIYACSVSAIKKLPQSSQQQRNQATKPQVSITPTKHVSFQEPPHQQKKSSGPVKQKDPQEMSGPWRREAQEKLEKQQRLQVVELLQQEVQELQAKAKRSAEENDRLRKLNLEWQFQKRLQEVQQRGEDEDEEEDEDLDMMVTLQQLEKRVQVECTHRLINELEKQAGTHLSQKEDRAKTGNKTYF
uniref:PDZ domain-containing protein n=1 Tax=Amphiprion ocellaris TaxID=80972 RepID=A0AAQ5YST2_AMPOC